MTKTTSRSDPPLNRNSLMGKTTQHVTPKEPSRLTLTEALAEIKTIAKRVKAKETFIHQYACRMESHKDPLHADGGSPTVIARERQGMADLLERTIAIRRAIAAANATSLLTVGGQERSIADWLTWKREVAPVATAFLATLRAGVTEVRRKATAQGVVLRPEGSTGTDKDVIVNVDESKLAADIEGLETVLGTLDGKLSHANATTFVDL